MREVPDYSLELRPGTAFDLYAICLPPHKEINLPINVPLQGWRRALNSSSALEGYLSRVVSSSTVSKVMGRLRSFKGGHDAYAVVVPEIQIDGRPLLDPHARINLRTFFLAEELAHCRRDRSPSGYLPLATELIEALKAQGAPLH